MEHKRKQFTFYSSFYDAIQELSRRQQGEIVLAVCAYALYGEVTELKGPAKCAFELIQPVLDTASTRSLAGKRGRELTRQKRKEQSEGCEQTANKPSSNVEQTPNKGEIEIESETEIESEIEIDNDCYARAEEVVQLYRKFCPGLIPCELLNAETRQAIGKRYREHGNLDIFRRLFRKAGSSDFLQGKITGWRASLDWLMEERNFAKVLNGVYDNRPDPRAVPKGASGELGEAELEAIQRVLREEP